MNSLYVQLAKESINYYLEHGEVLNEIDPKYNIIKNKQAGCFVSLHLNKQLRGCIGTILPVRKNLAEEIVHNAVSAASKDPRFSPLKKEESKELLINVDVLTEPETIKNKKLLDPKKYGVIVTNGYKKGVLLPDLDGVDTIEKQLGIALRKAGIYENDYMIQRFEVERYK